jgi:hypothetical protein
MGVGSEQDLLMKLGRIIEGNIYIHCRDIVARVRISRHSSFLYPSHIVTDHCVVSMQPLRDSSWSGRNPVGRKTPCGSSKSRGWYC